MSQQWDPLFDFDDTQQAQPQPEVGQAATDDEAEARALFERARVEFIDIVPQNEVTEGKHDALLVRPADASAELKTPRRDDTLPISTVFEAWEHDRCLGIVQHNGRRVFGLKPVGNGYRATVTGIPPVTSLESVLLEAETLLSVWGKE